MNIDTLALHCFLAVSESGSFTVAAKTVGRTQSAVSQQIAKLEMLLGKTLFQRGKSLQLTTDGELFLSYARRLYALHREALDHFREPDVAGEVRFGLPEGFASVLLSDVLVDFSRTHPRVALNVECDLTVRLYERFKQGAFDLVLVKMSRPEDFPNGVEVWSEPLEWATKEDMSLTDDKPVPLVLAPQPCVYRAMALQALEQTGRRWRIAFSSPSHASTVAAVNAGMGITVLPQQMITSPLRPLHHPLLPRLQDTHVSLLKQNTTNPAVQSFEGFVLKKLRVKNS
jgi:DNA-binding transcriptional LysR family regulator